MTNLTLGFDRVLRPGKLRAVALGVLLATGVAMGHDATYAAGHGAAQKPIRLAVLGDSDSHAYQDPLANGFGTAQARGGSWQGSTLQWTELLGRLRADEIEQGSFGPVGRQGPLAWLMRHTGFGPVRQKKQDFAFNFSYNGATCADLTRSDFGQAHLLTALLDSEPPAWSNRAAVLIRIGINDLGKREQMAQFARSGLDQAARKRVDQCADAVSAAMALVRTRHPGVLLIVVGILDNADWPPLHDQWQDPAPLGRIAAVLDAYDDRLRQAVAMSPVGQPTGCEVSAGSAH